MAQTLATIDPDLRVAPRPWRLDLTDERTFGPRADEACARFLARVFTLDEVRWVEVDRVSGRATVHHRAGPRHAAAFLKRLAATLRSVGGTSLPAFSRVQTRRNFSLHRHGAVVSSWEVLAERRGSLEMRQTRFLEETPRSRRVFAELAALPGVLRVRRGAWAGRVRIDFDPAVVSVARLLVLCHEVLEQPEPWGDPPPPPPTKYGLAPLTVGVAAGGVFLPELAVVSVTLLLGMNVRTFRAAYREVRGGRLGLPSLYSAIVVTTLATGQFLASALMTWFFRYWTRRYQNVLADARLEMLEECLPRPELARLVVEGGSEVLRPVDRLHAGDVFAVSAREIVPADGSVISGVAVVDESALTGRPGATRRRRGDQLLAGSVLLEGDLDVRVERAGNETRAAAIGRALVAATSPPTGERAPTQKAEMFANKAVAPTLAVAGLGGLALGDLLTVGAILRPDYATGPGISGPLGALGDVADCFDRGALIRDPEVLDRLAKVEVVVIDDRPELRRFALSVDRVETQLAQDLFFHLIASAFRHRADERAAALERACRGRGGHLVVTKPVDWRNGGVTVALNGHRVHVGESGPALGDEGGLAMTVDNVPIGLVSFRTGGRLLAADALETLQETEPDLRFALVSDRPSSEVAGLSVGLGVSFVQGNLDPIGKAGYVRAWRDEGRRVAFVGDCRAQALAASEADVAIDVGPDLASPAAVHVLDQGFHPLVALWRAARDHAQRGKMDRLGTLAPNLFCIAGAFLLGFTGLHAVILSNLGTYGLYTRAAARLESPRRSRSLAAALSPLDPMERTRP